MPERETLEIDGRRLKVSNLAKVLYPGDGTTKHRVIEHYVRVAEVMLLQLSGRPATRKRWPDGTGRQPFFEKNAPRGTPSWVRTVTLDSPGSTRDREQVTYPLVEGLATLVWLANLAALELHTPQWTVGPRGGVHHPDRLVVDLDPGAPAALAECAEVACLVRDRLAADGLETSPVTSGSKGLQLYARADRFGSAEETSAYAKGLAQRLERSHPELVVHRMTKALRDGKVLVDWSQNSAAKTTVSVYSLRARQTPTVSTPVSWDEVAACADPQDLVFTSDDVLARVEEQGDLFAPLLR